MADQTIEATPAEVQAAPAEIQAAPAVAETTPVDAPAPVEPQTAPVVASAAPVEVVASAAPVEDAGSADTHKRSAEEAGIADPAPAKKKPRITQATIKKFLRKGKLLEHQMFTWGDWEDIDGAEVGDITYYRCRMKVEIKNADGEVVLKPKQSVRKVDWYTSKSVVVFYPTGSVSRSVICPMSLSVPTPFV